MLRSLNFGFLSILERKPERVLFELKSWYYLGCKNNSRMEIGSNEYASDRALPLLGQRSHVSQYLSKTVVLGNSSFQLNDNDSVVLI
jgi:hypothetical protein